MVSLPYIFVNDGVVYKAYNIMKILGLGGLLHDASITLIKDGTIKLAVAVERVTREKHCGLLEADTFDFVLKELGLRVEDMDAICWADQFLYEKSQKASAIKEKIIKHPHYVFRHHECHAASSFYCSPFAEAIAITIDGKGDELSAGIYLGNNKGLEQVASTPMHFSIGRLWNAMNTIVGMPGYHNSGKTMALAAYGTPTYNLDGIVKFQNDGSFSFQYKNKDKGFFFLKENLIRVLTDISGLSPLEDYRNLSQDYFNLVASLQKLTNDAILYLGQWALKTFGNKPICLAGGVAMNTVSNTYFANMLKPQGIFIQPAASDEGLSLGAAILTYHNVSGERRHFSFTPFCGRSYTKEDIEKELSATNLKWRKSDDIYQEVAELLANGRVVGWFQGKEEFGPRALGNRSILADPRNASCRDYLNREVKGREWFRPFAPSIQENLRSELFQFNYLSPYMLFSPSATDSARRNLPAALHVDGTGRLQTVNSTENEKFYNLLEEFRKKTGLGTLLNTSFNMHGEAIVGSPKDALQCFQKSKIDHLAIGDFIVSK